MLHPLALLIVCPAALAANSFKCPSQDTTGYFPDPDQCDKYWDCLDGNAQARYCADGFAFKFGRRRTGDPCDYEWHVDCEGKVLQAPQGTGVCERKNGYYPHEDPDVCTSYYICNDNNPELNNCSPGTHYNIAKRVCDWKEVAQRGACGVKQVVDGFTCPGVGKEGHHPRYTDERDCRAFFVCLNGVTPQNANCPLGELFDDVALDCKFYALVSSCVDYYKEHPLLKQFVDEDGDGKVDVNFELAQYSQNF